MEMEETSNVQKDVVTEENFYNESTNTPCHNALHLQEHIGKVTPTLFCVAAVLSDSPRNKESI